MENINVKKSTEHTCYNYSKVKQIFLFQFHFSSFVMNINNMNKARKYYYYL